MKLLLVLGSNDNYEVITKSLQPMGFQLIRYRQVQKAMDNIDEINPCSIIISAKDFPRHWKIMVQFLRYDHPIESCPIILLKGSGFSTEETSKAFFLGVNGVIDDLQAKPEELDRLQNILSRYIPVNEKRKRQRYYVEPWHRINFIIANMAEKSIITGEVKTISSGGLSFVPAKTLALDAKAFQREYNECSLRIGDAIISPSCRLVRSGNMLSLEFISLSKHEQHFLDQYLDELPMLEPKAGVRKIV